MSNEKNKRRFEIDVAKFFAIIFMVLIHVYEEWALLGSRALPTDVFGNMIEFLGGPVTAPIFMFSMGIGMIYTRSNAPEDFAKRGLKLIVAGYALNFVRGTLPLMIYTMMGGDMGPDFTLMDSFMNTDILHFAGMAFLLAAGLKKLHVKPAGMFVFALILQAVGAWSVKLTFPQSIVSYLLGLIIYTEKLSCFSLTTWFIYPAAGMVFGELLLKENNKDGLYKKAMSIGLAGLIASVACALLNGLDLRRFYALADGIYYKQDFYSFLFTISLILAELSLAYFIFKKVSDTVPGRFISFCAVNLNAIYVTQWLVISAGIVVMVVAGMEALPKQFIAPCATAVLILAIGIVMFIRKKGGSNTKEYKAKKKQLLGL